MLHIGLDLSRKRLDYCLLTEDGECVGMGAAPPDADPSPHIGREAFERLALGFLESFPYLEFDVEELIDARDLVIASTVMHGRGAASGASVDDAYVFVYKLRDGLIVEGWEYRTRQQALEAVGLAG